MKKVMLFFACLNYKLKKNFFNYRYAVTNQNCKEKFKRSPEKDNNLTEEYLTSYKTTTRWQTL
jgi:hypothetical protein